MMMIMIWLHLAVKVVSGHYVGLCSPAFLCLRLCAWEENKTERRWLRVVPLNQSDSLFHIIQKGGRAGQTHFWKKYRFRKDILT